MARVTTGTQRNWGNGDTMTSDDFELERSILTTAINDNQDQHDALKATTGAGLVGVEAISGLSGVSVQDILEALKNRMDSTVLGQLPPIVANNLIEFEPSTNTGNNYAVTVSSALTSYSDGYGVAVRITADSTGATTLNVNGLGAKPIMKSNGSAVTNLKANGVYTFRYNGTTGNFILQGEGGSGNAQPGDILVGKTATTDSGDVTGTMLNRGTMTITAGNTDQIIPQGYHKGDGTVPAVLVPAANVLSGTTIAGTPGTMPNKIGSATVITPSTVDQAIPQGYFSGVSGDGKVLGDVDLVASNIASDTNIFGVQGSLARATDTNRTNLITSTNGILGL